MSAPPRLDDGWPPKRVQTIAPAGDHECERGNGSGYPIGLLFDGVWRWKSKESHERISTDFEEGSEARCRPERPAGLAPFSRRRAKLADVWSELFLDKLLLEEKFRDEVSADTRQHGSRQEDEGQARPERFQCRHRFELLNAT